MFILFKTEKELEQTKAAVHQMVEAAQALDGTATGEHGVGMGKIVSRKEKSQSAWQADDLARIGILKCRTRCEHCGTHGGHQETRQAATFSLSVRSATLISGMVTLSS